VVITCVLSHSAHGLARRPAFRSGRHALDARDHQDFVAIDIGEFESDAE
jgi:hypothetical protein